MSQEDFHRMVNATEPMPFRCWVCNGLAGHIPNKGVMILVDVQQWFYIPLCTSCLAKAIALMHMEQ
jgi:hypothetical protein